MNKKNKLLENAKFYMALVVARLFQFTIALITAYAVGRAVVLIGASDFSEGFYGGAAFMFMLERLERKISLK